MADSMAITYDDLSALADRIEATCRREVDLLRADIRDDLSAINARVGDLMDHLAQQRDRIDKSAMAIGDAKENVRVLKHDFNNHLHAHGLSRAFPGVAVEKPGKAFVAGAMAAVMVLAGVANVLWDFLPALLKRLLP